jgi:hypothetical protein
VPYVLQSLHAVPFGASSSLVGQELGLPCSAVGVHSGVICSFKTLLPFICKQKYSSEC